MTQPNIKECANIACTNTWEVLNETDAQKEICVLCEVEETTAWSSAPTAESEGWGKPQDYAAEGIEGDREELLGRFRQTGATQTHIDDEDTEGKVRIWITRPGRVRESRTGRCREARQYIIIGCLQQREEGGWEADEQLGDYLNRIRTTPPPAEWPDLQRAITTIDGSVTSHCRRSQEESR